MKTIFGLLLTVWITVSASAKVRTWKDNTGGFEVRAELKGNDGTAVTLQKQDGTEISVPIERLSDDDREYLAGGSFEALLEGIPRWLWVCFGIGLLITLISSFVLIVIAFQESLGWGLAYLFVPFAALFFIFGYWDRVKSPFLWGMIGSVMTIASIFLAFDVFNATES